MPRRRICVAGVVSLVVFSACKTVTQTVVEITCNPTPVYGYDSSRDLGPLFHDIQLARIFADSKTMVDARPLDEPAALAARYLREKAAPGFSLPQFVMRWFAPPMASPVVAGSAADASMEQHITNLWPALTRAADSTDPRSSLIALPKPYVVPGGRFREVYYWDSYFTMLGLVESKRTDLIANMLDNFSHLIMTVGHIPNANRTYYLSRSQPPYFAAMVGLYASATDSGNALKYLDALERDYQFWMDGASTLAPGTANRRVVRLRNGALLNRYWDDQPQPRPESYREDFELGQTVPEAKRESLFRNLRAAAESGWDFSSRWMRDTTDLRTLETVDLAPLDLNSLMYHTERTMAALYRLRKRNGDTERAVRFDSAATARRAALLDAAWDSRSGFFYDVRWRSGARVTDRASLAAASVLYFGLATPEQGRAVAAKLERDFLREGGFVTTLIRSGQQWDAPNGWPPLQWLTMQGVQRYGRADLAELARGRWLSVNRRVYTATGKMTEKYDVLDLSRPAGGGEYPTQDGFGWSNGVALALSRLMQLR
jgi:alpha,alpha-trehalase